VALTCAGSGEKGEEWNSPQLVLHSQRPIYRQYNVQQLLHEWWRELYASQRPTTKEEISTQLKTGSPGGRGRCGVC
jgi:hypothetical protein